MGEEQQVEQAGWGSKAQGQQAGRWGAAAARTEAPLRKRWDSAWPQQCCLALSSSSQGHLPGRTARDVSWPELKVPHCRHWTCRASCSASSLAGQGA